MILHNMLFQSGLVHYYQKVSVKNITVKLSEYVKITHIYLQVGKISVDGVTREKLAGGNTPVKIHSSNIIVTSIDFKDKFRKEKMEKVD